MLSFKLEAAGTPAGCENSMANRSASSSQPKPMPFKILADSTLPCSENRNRTMTSPSMQLSLANWGYCKWLCRESCKAPCPIKRAGFSGARVADFENHPMPLASCPVAGSKMAHITRSKITLIMPSALLCCLDKIIGANLPAWWGGNPPGNEKSRWILKSRRIFFQRVNFKAVFNRSAALSQLMIGKRLSTNSARRLRYLR